VPLVSLLAIVLLLTVSEPPLKLAIPPPLGIGVPPPKLVVTKKELPEMVLFETVNVPVLEMPPP
jgi:hypothetical protein